jgi:hypothetical protein
VTQSDGRFSRRCRCEVSWNRSSSRVVRIGQGKIGVCLARQRADPKVRAYESFGLLVIWAIAPLLQLDGIERYLADRWHPLVGGATPNAAPIAVNDPWTA